MSKKATAAAPVAGDQLPLALPYEAIPERPVREDLRSLTREEKIKRGKESYYIHHKDIELRSGFNPRLNIEGLPLKDYLEQDLQIPEAAQSLYTAGYPPPALKGDFTKEGKFIPADGHRRYYMIAWLLAEGHTHWPATGEPIEMVEVEPLPKEFTELDRAKLTIHSQNNLNLTPLEYGHQFLRLNRVFGVSHEDIAKEFHGGRSRQWVTNMIALAELPKDVQIKVKKGELTPTAAIALKTNIKDDKKLSETVSEAGADGISVKDALAMKEKKEEEPVDLTEYEAQMNAIIGRYEEQTLSFEGATTEAGEVFAQWTSKYAEQRTKSNIDQIYLNAQTKLTQLRDTPPQLDHNNDDLGEEDEEEEGTEDTTLPAPVNNGPVRTETDKANEVEENSHKTSATAPVVAPKSQKDALPDIDFSHEKEEGIMDLSEAIGQCDKISVRLKNIPMPEQHRNDLQAYLQTVVNKCTTAREILKKAADKR